MTRDGWRAGRTRIRTRGGKDVVHVDGPRGPRGEPPKATLCDAWIPGTATDAGDAEVDCRFCLAVLVATGAVAWCRACGRFAAREDGRGICPACRLEVAGALGGRDAVEVAVDAALALVSLRRLAPGSLPVPEGEREELGVEAGDEMAPLLSEAWLYPVVGKDFARSVLGALHLIEEAVGFDEASAWASEGRLRWLGRRGRRDSR